MVNPKVVVRRNTDETVLNKLFGDQIVAQAESNYIAGRDMFKDEPWDYIPPAGVSTRRGSRAVRDAEGTPFGSPSEIVDREIMRNPQLIGLDPRDIKPLAITSVNPNNIVNRVGDYGPAIPPPTQGDCIPEEYKHMMKKELNPHKKEKAVIETVGGPKMNNITNIDHPRQFVTEDIPSGARPDMCPPKAPGHVLPPSSPDVPRKITEDMIVKVSGYNETNMYLLTEVSKNVAYCSKVIAQLNNASKPVKMDEVMSLLAYMDNQEFRNVLVNTFTSIMKNNVQLSNEITKYLNGELPAEDIPVEDNPDNNTGDADTSSNAQNQSEQSASSENTEENSSSVSGN